MSNGRTDKLRSVCCSVLRVSLAWIVASLIAPTVSLAANQCTIKYINDESIVDIGFREVEAIRSGPKPVILIDDETLNDYESVTLKVYLDNKGRVTCIEPTSGPDRLLPQAMSLARQWTFKPYILKGKTIPVSFTQFIDVNWKSPRPNVRIPFPDIRDKSTLRMRLERHPGFMGCEAYAIEMRGDGVLTIDGDYGAAGRDHQVKTLSSDVVDVLANQFRTAEFFWLHNSYTGETQDLSTVELSIAFDEHKKVLMDGVGRETGMPVEVTQLENEIERLADAERLTAKVKCRSEIRLKPSGPGSGR